jgi:hypothetical protein
MNVEVRLAKLDRVDAMLSEALALIHERRAELAKQASPERLAKWEKVDALFSDARALVRKHRQGLAKRLSPSEQAAGANPVEMIKSIHQQGGHNLFEENLRQLPGASSNESDVLKAIKEAHRTGQIRREDLLTY